MHISIGGGIIHLGGNVIADAEIKQEHYNLLKNSSLNLMV